VLTTCYCVASSILLCVLFAHGDAFWPDARSRMRWGYGLSASMLLLAPVVRACV
jgi:hypothetical protein